MINALNTLRYPTKLIEKNYRKLARRRAYMNADEIRNVRLDQVLSIIGDGGEIENYQSQVLLIELGRLSQRPFSTLYNIYDCFGRLSRCTNFSIGHPRREGNHLVQVSGLTVTVVWCVENTSTRCRAFSPRDVHERESWSYSKIQWRIQWGLCLPHWPLVSNGCQHPEILSSSLHFRGVCNRVPLTSKEKSESENSQPHYQHSEERERQAERQELSNIMTKKKTVYPKRKGCDTMSGFPTKDFPIDWDVVRALTLSAEYSFCFRFLTW